MTVENFPERRASPPDRSEQVLFLLSELSDRLRKGESERDAVKREILTLRDSIQDLDDRNSQTQKALLAFQNKFDDTETSVETTMRRLTGLEGTIDNQSGELLGILRKIEERFEAYDREYKNHAASIQQYADTLDRFDSKIEKLIQDKGRLSRKIDALEFQLADSIERMQSTPLSAASREVPLPRRQEDEAPGGLQVWSPESAKPQFMHGPGEIPAPSFAKAVATKWSPRLWQYVSIGLFSVLMSALVFGIVYALLRHPAETTTQAASISTPAPAAPVENVVTPLPESTPTVPAPAVSSATPLPDKNFFSKSVRSAMDQQIIAARKIEDDDTARLMAMADPGPLSRRIKRDTNLPRVIKAIEAKAMEGNPEAQHDMGAMYSSGQSGVAVDYTRAATWFRTAAEGGNGNARYNLGVLYQQGLGVEKDVDQALSWYRAASLLDHPEARYNLGIAYVEGIGVAYNPAMAAGYFEQAARVGVIESAYNLGMILENGLIDEPRPFEALFWYKLAADGGSQDGQSALMRLMDQQKIESTELQPLFDRMLAERPDLKSLAESRRTRSVKSERAAPQVRIHTPTNKTNSSAPNVPPKAKTMPEISAKTISVPIASVSPTLSAPDDLKKSVASNPVISVPLPPSDTDLTRATAPVVSAKPSLEKTLTADDPRTVARIQTMLADEGLYKGKPDGQSGPATADAIRRYQIKYEMDVDGKPSTNLLAQMLARRLAITAEPAAGNNGNGTLRRSADESVGTRVNN